MTAYILYGAISNLFMKNEKSLIFYQIARLRFSSGSGWLLT